MDIGIEWKSRTRDSAPRAGVGPGAPEWRGLRARLAAGHAAGRALMAQALNESASAGSFDGVSARALADYGGEYANGDGPAQGSVNPVFWANGKPVRTMDAAVAGATSHGDRG